MNTRPDYIKCIADAHDGRKGLSYCGKPLADFHFVNTDHATLNGLARGRLLACPECVAVIVQGLENGRVD